MDEKVKDKKKKLEKSAVETVKNKTLIENTDDKGDFALAAEVGAEVAAEETITPKVEKTLDPAAETSGAIVETAEVEKTEKVETAEPNLEEVIKRFDKKETVEDTLKELEEEKKLKESTGKRKKFLNIIKWIPFPITLLVMLFNKIAKKIKIPITVKMLIIYSLVFILIITAFTAFFISSVSSHIDGSPEGIKYIKNLKITTGICIGVLSIVFMALVGVVSSLMLNPIRKITDKIDSITTENLSARLEIIDTQDELMELTERINEMLDNIEESFIRQQNFVSDASHELKTPIAVIQGYSNLLKRWGAEDKAILTEGIESISRESDNMRRIVEQLLLLARLGKMNMNPSRFNLFEVLDDMIDGYRVVNSTHKIVFDGDEKIVLDTDKNLLLECVRAIVDNAIKYTPSGGSVFVDCFMENDAAKIVVRDTGVGIKDEDLAKIFDRFFRCDKARGRETGSSGLGLTIAKSIVEMMGGDITVASKFGIGTTFTISLY